MINLLFVRTSTVSDLYRIINLQLIDQTEVIESSPLGEGGFLLCQAEAQIINDLVKTVEPKHTGSMQIHNYQLEDHHLKDIDLFKEMR